MSPLFSNSESFVRTEGFNISEEINASQEMSGSQEFRSEELHQSTRFSKTEQMNLFNVSASFTLSAVITVSRELSESQVVHDSNNLISTDSFLSSDSFAATKRDDFPYPAAENESIGGELESNVGDSTMKSRVLKSRESQGLSQGKNSIDKSLHSGWDVHVSDEEGRRTDRNSVWSLNLDSFHTRPTGILPKSKEPEFIKTHSVTSLGFAHIAGIVVLCVTGIAFWSYGIKLEWRKAESEDEAAPPSNSE
jgi:hypothetical protein